MLTNVSYLGNQGSKNANHCIRIVYNWIVYDCYGNSMVYLESLYSRLDRLAKCQGSPFSTEAQQENIIFKNFLYFYKKKYIRTKNIALI